MLLLDLFADGRIAETVLSMALSTTIAIALAFSIPKLLVLLKAMNQGSHEKTLIVQRVLLGLIAVLDIVFVSLKLKYIDNCENSELFPEWAPIVDRLF